MKLSADEVATLRTNRCHEKDGGPAGFRCILALLIPDTPTPEDITRTTPEAFTAEHLARARRFLRSRIDLAREYGFPDIVMRYTLRLEALPIPETQGRRYAKRQYSSYHAA